MLRLQVAALAAWVLLLGGCSKPSPEHGEVVYKAQCARCHAAARTRLAYAPPLEGYFQKIPTPTEREARDVIRNGRNFMPPFKARLKSREVDDVVAYLKRLRPR